MTDHTIPAGLTRDEARAVREWAERARSAEEQDETVLHAARGLLAVLPKCPTLADMTMEERHACRWMQADTKLWGRVVIVLHNAGGGRAVTLNREGHMAYEDHGTINRRRTTNEEEA